MSRRALSSADEARHSRISAFVQRESPRLLDYFGRRVSQAEDAADLVGETLLVVWRRAGSVPDDEEEARMWLFGVARRVLSTHFRGRGRRIALADRLREEIATSSATAGLDGRPGSAHDERSRVRELVSELAAIDREIVTLVHWDGFSLREAARILSIGESTARSRHARAQKRLREVVDEARAALEER